MENERFFAYYKAQKIVPEEEWDEFVDALRQHLPTTFRVAGSRQYAPWCLALCTLKPITYFRIANALNSMIKDIHVPTLSDVVFEGQKIPPPVQIPWYNLYDWPRCKHRSSIWLKVSRWSRVAVQCTQKSPSKVSWIQEVPLLPRVRNWSRTLFFSIPGLHHPISFRATFRGRRLSACYLPFSLKSNLIIRWAHLFLSSFRRKYFQLQVMDMCAAPGSKVHIFRFPS